MVKAVLSTCERKFLRKARHTVKGTSLTGKGPISRRLFCYLGLSEIVILSSGVLTALAPASNARKAATALYIA